MWKSEISLDDSPPILQENNAPQVLEPPAPERMVPEGQAQERPQRASTSRTNNVSSVL